MATTVVHKREPHDVYIGRGSDWGNPFSHLSVSKASFKVATRKQAVAEYEKWVRSQPHLVARIKSELRGKVLGCFCQDDQLCHGEVLCRIADEAEQVELREDGTLAVVHPQPLRRPEPPVIDARALGAKCGDCPLAKDGRPVGPSLASRRRGAKFVVIGEAPGRMEVARGDPFIGPSGKLLDKVLDQAGLDRREAHVTNAMMCLDNRTEVRLPGGERMRIDRLVKSKYAGKVLTVDGDGCLTERRVVGWYKNPLAGRKIVSVSYRYAKTAGGRGSVRSLMTDDHRVLTVDGWVPAGKVAGRLIATGDAAPYSTSFDIAVGTLLGDATICRNRSYLQFVHAKDQEQYAQLKAKALQAVCITENVVRVGSKQPRVIARTYSSGFFRQLRDEFYPNGKKVIPRVVAKNLSDLSLAVWFLDDGCMRIRTGRRGLAEICTAGFERTDVEWAVVCLNDKGFDCHISRPNRPLRIHFSAAGSRELSRRIAQYVPCVMQYKLLPEHRGQFDAIWFRSILSPFYDRAVVKEVKAACKTVYCIDVEETHRFVTTGTVVHNCRPDDDRPDVKLAALSCCAPRLARELEEHAPNVPVLALGAVASKAILGVGTILKARGFVWDASEIEDKKIEQADKALKKLLASAGGKPSAITLKRALKKKQANYLLKARQKYAGRKVIASVHPAFILRGADGWYPVLEGDARRFGRLLREELTYDDGGSYKIARTGAQVLALVPKLDRKTEVKGIALDIETDGADPLHSKITVVGLSDGDNTVEVWPWRKALAKPLMKALKGKTIVTHYGRQFDLIRLSVEGFKHPFDLCEDTHTAHHAFASHLPKSLSHVVSVYCDARPWKLMSGKGATAEKGEAPRWASGDAEDLLRYNADDVILDARAWKRMQADLESERHVYQSDKRITLMCQRMTEVGIGIDTDKRAELEASLKARKRALLGMMRQLVGRRQFKPGNVYEVRAALFGRFKAPLLRPTPTGLASTNNETLEFLRVQDTRAGKLADLLLRWRAADKTLGSYVKNIPFTPISKSYGRVHPPWKLGPVTGRLSCWLMTLPRYGDDLEEQVRGLYLAGPSNGKARLVAQIHDAAIIEMDGYFIYFDLSQAEARLAAHFSGDEHLIEACKKDIHTANALVVFGGIPEAAARLTKANELSPHLDHHGKPLKWKAVPSKSGGCKDERDIAKNCGFCVWYEGTAERAFITLRSAGKEASLAACEELVRRFHSRYTRYYQYVDENERYVREHGHLRTVMLGRIRWLGWHAKRTEIANFPIQSGIADIQNERLPEIEDRLPGCKDPEDVKKLIEETWARPIKVPHNGLEFVMPTEVKIGSSWKDFG